MRLRLKEALEEKKEIEMELVSVKRNFLKVQAEVKIHKDREIAHAAFVKGLKENSEMREKLTELQDLN